MGVCRENKLTIVHVGEEFIKTNEGKILKVCQRLYFPYVVIEKLDLLPMLLKPEVKL